MKITCITISVDYSDFLCWSLTENKTLFDQWIIVTSTKDTKTKELCDNHNVFCLQTDVFYEKGIFNKYAGINEALKLVDEDSWVLFLDSDIMLPTLTKYILENIKLDPSCIYGIDRVNCEGLEKWIEYINKRNITFQNWLLHTSGMPLGARLVHYFGEARDEGRFLGWRPLGFFQLAHRTSFSEYPQNTIGADHCDLEFVRNWPREKRVFIPEILAIHLESVGATKGINWYGRKSSPFKTGIKVKWFQKIKQFFNRYIVGYFEKVKYKYYN